MVSFINYNDFCLFRNLVHQILILLQKQISVIDDFEGIEALKNLGDVFLDSGFPYWDSGRCRNDQYNILTLFLDKTLNEHHANIGFAQADTITKKCTWVFAGNFDHAIVAVSLILRKSFVNNRVMILPFGNGFFTTLEILVHGTEIDIIGTELLAVVLNYLKHCICNVNTIFPTGFKPLLQLLNIILHLNIQFNVLSKSCLCEVAGTYQRITSRNVHCLNKLIAIFISEVSDIGFSMEFAFVVNTAFDLARLHGIKNRRNAN